MVMIAFRWMSRWRCPEIVSNVDMVFDTQMSCITD